MTDRDEVLRQVLEIVDMFEDENLEISSDIVTTHPTLRREIVMYGKLRHDCVERRWAEDHAETAMAARMIGAAIREKFGLPPKKGEG